MAYMKYSYKIQWKLQKPKQYFTCSKMFPKTFEENENFNSDCDVGIVMSGLNVWQAFSCITYQTM